MRVLNGEIIMGGYDFPICLYDLDVYDGKDRQLGLLRSPLLV